MPYLKINCDGSLIDIDESSFFDFPVSCSSLIDFCYSYNTILPTCISDFVLVCSNESLLEANLNLFNKGATFFRSNFDPIYGDVILARLDGSFLYPLSFYEIHCVYITLFLHLDFDNLIDKL